jgi:hypothetical protein
MAMGFIQPLTEMGTRNRKIMYKVLSRIFGPTRGLRKLRNELSNCTVRQVQGKIPLGRPTRNGVDDIKMDLRGIGWGVVDWIDLAPG